MQLSHNAARPCALRATGIPGPLTALHVRIVHSKYLCVGKARRNAVREYIPPRGDMKTLGQPSLIAPFLRNHRMVLASRSKKVRKDGYHVITVLTNLGYLLFNVHR